MRTRVCVCGSLKIFSFIFFLLLFLIVPNFMTMFSVYLYVSVLFHFLAAEHFTQQWAVHVPGGKRNADAVALDHGFRNLGQVR